MTPNSKEKAQVLNELCNRIQEQMERDKRKEQIRKGSSVKLADYIEKENGTLVPKPKPIVTFKGVQPRPGGFLLRKYKDISIKYAKLSRPHSKSNEAQEERNMKSVLRGCANMNKNLSLRLDNETASPYFTDSEVNLCSISRDHIVDHFNRLMICIKQISENPSKISPIELEELRTFLETVITLNELNGNLLPNTESLIDYINYLLTNERKYNFEPKSENTKKYGTERHVLNESDVPIDMEKNEHSESSKKDEILNQKSKYETNSLKQKFEITKNRHDDKNEKFKHTEKPILFKPQSIDPIINLKTNIDKQQYSGPQIDLNDFRDENIEQNVSTKNRTKLINQKTISNSNVETNGNVEFSGYVENRQNLNENERLEQESSGKKTVHENSSVHITLENQDDSSQSTIIEYPAKIYHMIRKDVSDR